MITTLSLSLSLSLSLYVVITFSRIRSAAESEGTPRRRSGESLLRSHHLRSMDDCASASPDYDNVQKNRPILDPCNSANFNGDSRPQKKPKRSNAWDYFDKIGVAEDGKEKCKCKGCGKVYTCGSRVGTTVLHRHIHKSPKPYNVGRKTKVDCEESGARKLDQKIVRELMTRMIIQHDLPFQLVEWGGFKEYTKYISSDEVQCVSRDVVTADVMKVYMLEKEKLKNQLARISGRVCLTFNCWTSGTTRGYFTLTAHYVDENWKLNIKLLNFCHLSPPHTGYELQRKVFDCLQEWGITKKIFSVTLDASSSDNMQDILKTHLGLCNSLLCNGDFFHIKCCAHILDLIVQEGLEVVRAVLQKIRERVKYVSRSESRLKQFYQCIEEVGGIDSRDGLHLDASGRWGATYIMLESAIKYRRAFDCLRLKDTNFFCMHFPWNEEWNREWTRAEKICELLMPFYELTNMISRSTYPTSNTYFMKIWMIEIRIKENKLSEDNMIRDMASKMMDEFEKYLSEHSMILAIGCVLDPRLKFQYLEHIYSKFDSNINVVEEKLTDVRKALYALFNEYANKCPSTSSGFSTMDSGSSTPTHNKRKRESNLPEERYEFDEIERQKTYTAGKTQLDLYLEEPSLLHMKDLNALDYWKNNGHGFGDLRRMGRDVLSIPIFTAISDCTFSIGGSIFKKYRSCMLSKNLQARICSHNWLFGFSRSDRLGDVMEETRKIDINLSREDSNVIVSNESKNED